MKVYRYWARGVASVGPDDGTAPDEFIAYAGSDRSIEDARRQAVEKATKIGRAVFRSEPPDAYLYCDRPIREEIIEEFHRGDFQSAVITRNVYGALVLNTAEAMFIDIDYPYVSPFAALFRWFAGLFGKKSPSADEKIIRRVGEVVEAERNLGLRLYRTANGYRCLVTSQTFQPTSNESTDLMKRFGADPMYVRLCREQECFRARISPKFYRLRLERPPGRYPFENDGDRAEYDRWTTEYDVAARNFTTCVFLEHFGRSNVDERVRPIVETHDRFACRSSEALA
jgi:hypothetical protein